MNQGMYTYKANFHALGGTAKNLLSDIKSLQYRLNSISNKCQQLEECWESQGGRLYREQNKKMAAEQAEMMKKVQGLMTDLTMIMENYKQSETKVSEMNRSLPAGEIFKV